MWMWRDPLWWVGMTMAVAVALFFLYLASRVVSAGWHWSRLQVERHWKEKRNG